MSVFYKKLNDNDYNYQIKYISEGEGKMNKKVAAIMAALLVVIVGVFSIGMKKEKAPEVAESTKVTVTDANGEQVELNKNPQRVVVFDHGVADILHNMDVEIVGLAKGKKLPEVISYYDDEKYANVGSLKEPDFEAIKALNPDLIIISGRQAEMAEDFEEIAQTVNLATDGTKYLASFKSNVESLGKIFDKEDKVSELISGIEKKVADLNKTITEKKLNATTVLTSEGNLSVFSGESRFGMIYNELGFANPDDKIEASTHGQQVSFEYLLEHDAQYIFVVSKDAAIGGDADSSVLDNDIVKNTSAYKNGKVINLNSEAWYLVSGGIDSTNIMLDEIANAIK